MDASCRKPIVVTRFPQALSEPLPRLGARARLRDHDSFEKTGLEGDGVHVYANQGGDKGSEGRHGQRSSALPSSTTHDGTTMHRFYDQAVKGTVPDRDWELFSALLERIEGNASGSC